MIIGNKLQLITILGIIGITVLLFVAPREGGKYISTDEKTTYVVDLVKSGQIRAPMQAILLLSALADLHPEIAKLQLELGNFSMQTKQYDKAIRLFTNVKNLDTANIYDAQSYLSEAKISLAITCLQSDTGLRSGTTLLGNVLNEDPENPKVHYYLGQLLLQMKQYPEAIDYFKQAIELDKKNEYKDVLFTIADTYAYIGDYSEAIGYLEEFKLDNKDTILIDGIDKMIIEYKKHLN